MDRAINEMNSAISDISADFQDKVISSINSGQNMLPAAQSAASNLVYAKVIASHTTKGWKLSWIETGKEIKEIIIKSPELENLIPKSVAKTYYRVPDGWNKEAWNWIFNQQTKINSEIPNYYIDKYIQKRSSMVAQSVDKEMINAITTINIEANKKGLSVKNTIKLLKEEFPNKSKARLETIARTECANLWETGRISRYRSDPIIDGVRFDAINDSRISQTCQWHNNKCYRLDGQVPTPPLHHQCRSTLTPIIIGDDVIYEEGQPPDNAKPQKGFGNIPEDLLPKNVNMSILGGL